MKSICIALVALSLVSPAIAGDKEVEAREDYGRELKRTLRLSGVDLAVYAEPKREDRLVFFGYMNKATVQVILTKLNVLKDAKTLKFREVLFHPKNTDEGPMTFDISGEKIPLCTKQSNFCL